MVSSLKRNESKIYKKKLRFIRYSDDSTAVCDVVIWVMFGGREFFFLFLFSSLHDVSDLFLDVLHHRYLDSSVLTLSDEFRHNLSHTRMNRWYDFDWRQMTFTGRYFILEDCIGWVLFVNALMPDTQMPRRFYIHWKMLKNNECRSMFRWFVFQTSMDRDVPVNTRMVSPSTSAGFIHDSLSLFLWSAKWECTIEYRRELC